MRPLVSVRPTPQQISIVSSTQLGSEVIRGCAGSGKTTTALMKIGSLAYAFKMQKERDGKGEKAKGLVLTFNRTLRAYVKDLASQQIGDSAALDLEICTFAFWSKGVLNTSSIIKEDEASRMIQELGKNINLDPSFLEAEVEYLRGRFFPENYSDYIDITRTGRGTTPRVDKVLREKILNEVVYPYEEHLNKNSLYDWNSMAVALAKENAGVRYDFIVVDETQDFSANQLRAIMNHLAEKHCVTFVLDTAQRIYARGFTWQEAGINIVGRSKRLTINYRNTSKLVDFASSLLSKVNLDDDATLPNRNDCQDEGELPIIVKGRFAKQTEFFIEFLNNIDLENNTVGIFHRFGGGWFGHLREQLTLSGMDFLEISRRSEWPKGEANIALSTMHSAKGLEFDYVIIAGLSNETYSYENEDDHDNKVSLFKLLAMSVTRARKNVVIGMDSTKPAEVCGEFQEGTYREIIK